jgi:hypothetical protein
MKALSHIHSLKEYNFFRNRNSCHDPEREESTREELKAPLAITPSRLDRSVNRQKWWLNDTSL